MMMAQVCDLEPGEFVRLATSPVRNHVEQAREQLTRDPRPLPQMWMNPGVKDLFAFTYDDFKLLNYIRIPTAAVPSKPGPCGFPSLLPWPATASSDGTTTSCGACATT